ncbi:MAG: hypothetical protein ACRBF0_07190 [Calditrichia bacterium]
MAGIVEKRIDLLSDQFIPEEYVMGPDITTVEKELWGLPQANFPEKIVIYYYCKGELVGCQIVQVLPYPVGRA